MAPLSNFSMGPCSSVIARRSVWPSRNTCYGEGLDSVAQSLRVEISAVDESGGRGPSEPVFPN
jgi:hypothetical protein